jgi:hypothetical protein
VSEYTATAPDSEVAAVEAHLLSRANSIFPATCAYAPAPPNPTATRKHRAPWWSHTCAVARAGWWDARRRFGRLSAAASAARHTYLAIIRRARSTFL